MLVLFHGGLTLVLLLLWQPYARPSNVCEPLKESVCRKLGYNTTIVPNLFGHRSQRRAIEEMQQLAPLRNVGCSKDTGFFLCSVYFPLCTQLKTVIQPCRALCLTVKTGCMPVLKKFGYDWPRDLRCERFPKIGSGQLCVSRNSSSSHTVPVPATSGTIRETTLPTKRPITRKQRHKVCWESKNGADKQCCRQGNKAAKINITKCSLQGSHAPGKGGKKLSRKQTRFFKKAAKICSSNKMSSRCYQSCCRYKNRQLRHKKRTRSTKRRQS